MELTYYKTDSAFNLVPQTDTISVFIRKARANPRAKKQESKAAKVVHYGFSTNANGTFEVYNPIYVRFDAPLANADISKIVI